MKTLLRGAFALLLMAGVAHAQADPCADMKVPKQNIPITLASAASTALVPKSGSLIIYVCGYSMTVWGTGTPTVQFVNAVNTPCVSTTPITGTYLGAAATTSSVQLLVGNGGQTVFSTVPGGNLCLAGTGGGLSVQGQLTYVQRPQ